MGNSYMGMPPLPVNTHDRKHYLPAALLVGGNNFTCNTSTYVDVAVDKVATDVVAAALIPHVAGFVVVLVATPNPAPAIVLAVPNPAPSPVAWVVTK